MFGRYCYCCKLRLYVRLILALLCLVFTKTYEGLITVTGQAIY